MKILFVVAREPYPPLKGDQVRSYNQIRELSKRHKVTLITFATVTSPPDGPNSVELERLCDKVIRIKFSWRRNIFSALVSTILKFWPGQVGLFHSRQLTDVLRSHLKTGKYDILHVQLSRMASHIPQPQSTPVVIDLVDALCLNMSRRADQETWWKRPALRLEARLLRRWERGITKKINHCIVVSDVDKSILDNPDGVHVIPNGVDLERFSFQPKGRTLHTIVFSGNMSYFPNVDAACWFAISVFPIIQSQIPNVEFVILGTNPHSRILRLAQDNPFIKVTGFVTSMEEHLGRMTVAVAPMRSGTGIQNKVIEAMATGLPVVATSFAHGGLKARPGIEIMIGNTPEEMATHLISLLKDPLKRKKMAHDARNYVEQHHSWQSSVERMEQVWNDAITDHSSMKNCR